MAAPSTRFGCGLEEGLGQQLLALNDSDVATLSGGSIGLTGRHSSLPQDESELSPRSGSRPQEVTSYSAKVDKLYRLLIAHLLEVHGGPNRVVRPDCFDSSMHEFCTANADAIQNIPVDPQDAGEQNEGAIGGLLERAEESRARYLSGRLLNLYDDTLRVGMKYQLLPIPEQCSSCGSQLIRAPVDSGIGTQGQSPLALQNVPAKPAAIVWAPNTYYSNPVPGPEDFAGQILRASNHPCFEQPLPGSFNWRFHSPVDCQGSVLTLTGWVPPTSCKIYRESLAKELYSAMLVCIRGQVLDANDTRVFISWENLKHETPLAYLKVAWRIVAKIHKFHMFAEEAYGMNFFARVASVTELCRLAKGTCHYLSKDGQMKNIVKEPVAKIKTFTYNQASNKRKKERESDHVGLYELNYGETPPWKAAKKRKAPARPRGRKGVQKSPEPVEDPAADENDEYVEETPTQGAEQNPEEPAPKAAIKRKRSTKASKAAESDGPAPKTRQNPATRTANMVQRKLAPAPPPATGPAPWIPELHSPPKVNSEPASQVNSYNVLQRAVANPSQPSYPSPNGFIGSPPLPLPSNTFIPPMFNEYEAGTGYMNNQILTSSTQDMATPLQFFQGLQSEQQQLNFLEVPAHPPGFPRNISGVQFAQPQFNNPFSQTQQQSYVGPDNTNFPTSYSTTLHYLHHTPPQTSAMSPGGSQIIGNADHFLVENDYNGSNMTDEEVLAICSIFNPDM